MITNSSRSIVDRVNTKWKIAKAMKSGGSFHDIKTKEDPHKVGAKVYLTGNFSLTQTKLPKNPLPTYHTYTSDEDES